MTRVVRTIVSAAVATLAMESRAFACPVCVGLSDSPLASGMNAGVLVLLGVTICVLAVILAVGRRVARLAAYGNNEGAEAAKHVGPTFRSGETGERLYAGTHLGPTFTSGATLTTNDAMATPGETAEGPC